MTDNDPGSAAAMRELMDRLAKTAGADDWGSWDGSIADLPPAKCKLVAQGMKLIEDAVSDTSNNGELE